MLNTLKKFLNIQTLILTLTISLVSYNAFFLFVYVMSQWHKTIAVLEPGSQYTGLKEKLGRVKVAGFLTNKDISPEKNEGEFLQAQYYLAPVILDLNNPRHEYAILDYTSPFFLGYVLKRLNAEHIADNPYQKVLARRRK